MPEKRDDIQLPRHHARAWPLPDLPEEADLREVVRAIHAGLTEGGLSTHEIVKLTCELCTVSLIADWESGPAPAYPLGLPDLPVEADLRQVAHAIHAGLTEGKRSTHEILKLSYKLLAVSLIVDRECGRPPVHPKGEAVPPL